MPRFHLNVFTDADVFDSEGIDRATLADVEVEAIKGARALIAALIQAGEPVDCSHRIEITDEAGRLLRTVRFGEVLDVRP